MTDIITVAYIDDEVYYEVGQDYGDGVCTKILPLDIMNSGVRVYFGNRYKQFNSVKGVYSEPYYLLHDGEKYSESDLVEIIIKYKRRFFNEQNN